MTAQPNATPAATWVAIDIAKRHHAVLIETPDGKQQQFRMASSMEEHDRLVALLRGLPQPARIAMEPTGDCHRTLAFRLLTEGFDVCLVSSVAGARYREAMFNSWDKNDPKDARVILALLKQGMTLRYIDPLLAGYHGLQELSKTHYQISLARTRLQHSFDDALSAAVLSRNRALLRQRTCGLVRPLHAPLSYCGINPTA